MISKPTNNNIDTLSQLTTPVEYSTSKGLALLLSNAIVSSKTAIPYTRIIPTAQFITGNYLFPTPAGYEPTPYTLPMLESKSWEVSGDPIEAYIPVASYQIGNWGINDEGEVSVADIVGTDFPIRINTSNYTHEGSEISPLEPNQSVTITIFKEPSVKILWDQSNIVNNGLIDEVITTASSILMFVVTNTLGVYYITDWIMPSFVLDNLSDLKTTNKATFSAVINEIYDKCDNAGGDLQGKYPNPILKNGAVTGAKIEGRTITTNNIATGGVQTRNIYPASIVETLLADNSVSTRTLMPNCVTTDKITPDAIDSTKIKMGGVTSDNIGVGEVREVNIAPNSVWIGAYKNLSIPTTALSTGCVTADKIASGTITGANMATETISARNIGLNSVSTTKISNGAITSEKINSAAGVYFYDYVVNSDATLMALNNNTTAVNVLIKKGTYYSYTAVSILNNVKTITGEWGNHLIFGTSGTAVDGFVCSGVSGPPGIPGSPGLPGPIEVNGFTPVICGVKITAERWAFKGFPVVYNCDGTVLYDSSYGPAAFYNCKKVIDCICRVPNTGGKIFSMDKCFNVRGCIRAVLAPNVPAPYRASYSGNLASTTYACADTPNGGWNN